MERRGGGSATTLTLLPTSSIGTPPHRSPPPSSPGTPLWRAVPAHANSPSPPSLPPFPSLPSPSLFHAPHPFHLFRTFHLFSSMADRPHSIRGSHGASGMYCEASIVRGRGGAPLRVTRRVTVRRRESHRTARRSAPLQVQLSHSSGDLTHEKMFLTWAGSQCTTPHVALASCRPLIPAWAQLICILTPRGHFYTVLIFHLDKHFSSPPLTPTSPLPPPPPRVLAACHPGGGQAPLSLSLPPR